MTEKKTSCYPESDANPQFPELEQGVLNIWQKSDAFVQSVNARAANTDSGENNEYVFYDGPPFANGLPHHGHLLTGYVKDLFARYHTMKGERVERRFGWDCHGLPAEMAAEKELNVSGRKNIMDFGIKNFNEHCRTSVMQFADQWEWYVNRQARWVDFKNDYKTMDKNFMESTIWAFSELNKKGYIYEGFKVMPYSWAAETVLSTSEIRLDDATREKEDKAVTVAFKLKQAPEGAPEADNYYILAWTTTPWTLPSNLALAASEKHIYTTILHDGNCYTCAKSYAAQLIKILRDDLEVETNVLKNSGIVDYRVKEKYSNTIHEEMQSYLNSSFEGKKLIGLSYEPIFPYFKGTPHAHRILDGSSFIEEGSGTGIVHMAPGFGEDDQRVCAEAGVETIVPVNGEGRYTDAIYDLPAVKLCHPAGGEAAAQDLDSVQSLRDSQNDYLETRRCILRRPTAEDEQHFINLHTNETVMDTMNDGPLTLEQAKEDFAKNQAHFDEHGYGQWAVFNKETGEFMGRAGLSFIAQSQDEQAMPTLRCGLMPNFWKGGYGSELCNASLWYGFSERGFDEIAAGAVPHNPRAHVMMKNLGMRHTKDVMFKRMVGPYFRMTKAEFEAKNPPLSLRGLNVIKETKGKCEAEPYSDAQLEKYGLANLRIINWLKMTGQLIKQEDYKHNYPHCWRTDQPIIYMAVSSWFVDVPQFRDRMVELNQDINWIPGHIKDGRFGKWLENAREWSISRSRFWGCPIPVWRSDNPDNKELYVFGSIAELEAFFDQPVKDLHRPYIDELTKPCPKNPEYTIRRVEDVFDCWFESGSMPYAQVHYPFENKDWFEDHFPADFIVEYEAQTRGWFYSMMVLSVALFDRIPFKNCICHGVVLDESGRKLSKKLQNYMDPKILFEQYGSDALRWFMMASPIMRGSELLLDAEGKFIHDAIRLYIKPIWNAYHFFTLYANADGMQAKFATDSENLMDRYILAKCRAMVEATEAALDAYDTPTATQAITEFVEILNNWYIRRNKDRFWNDRKDADKQAAYDTLYSVLHMLCRTASPLLPMVTESIYRGLTGEESVHLADWPVTDWPTEFQGTMKWRGRDAQISSSEDELIIVMDRVREVCSTALSIRNECNIRVRQPLAEIKIYGGYGDGFAYQDLILGEINVKNLSVHQGRAIDEVAEQKLTIFFPVAGKRLGKKMKDVGAAAKRGEWKVENGQMIVGGEALEPEEYNMQLVPKDGISGAQALSSNDALVVLDLEITPELKAEGTARDVVRMIQQARKDADLNVADRIILRIDASEEVTDAIDANRDYIAEQTLANALVLDVADGSKFIERGEIDGAPIAIGISLAQKDAA